MSTVVGLVKARLRSKSRRGKSIDDFDVVVDGNGLVTQRSLRQFALAEPTDEDVAYTPSIPSDARSPLDLDPARLAQDLSSSPDSMQISPADGELQRSLPARKSSLSNRSNFVLPNMRGSPGQTGDISPAMPSATSSERTRGRLFTISSPTERPQLDEFSDYFGKLRVAAPQEPATLTARLYGPIASQAPVQNSRDGHSRQSSIPHNGRREGKQEPPQSGLVDGQVSASETIQSRRNHKVSNLNLRPRAQTYDGPKSPGFYDSEQQVYVPPAKEEQSVTPVTSNLPAGFVPGYTERTSVDTQWHPAVEQHRLHVEKTEVTHPTIERDIHIHHYYEYEQPVKVVEVLPPRHYHLDERTGEKIEIQAPAEWTMPQSLVPAQPDFGDLKATHRHYVVNDKHPTGMPEDWPLKADSRTEEPTTWI